MNRKERLRILEDRAKNSVSAETPPEFLRWSAELDAFTSAVDRYEPGHDWRDWAYSDEELEEFSGRKPTPTDPVWKKAYEGPAFPGLDAVLGIKAVAARFDRNRAQEAKGLTEEKRLQLHRALAARKRSVSVEAIRTGDWSSHLASLDAERRARDEWMVENGFGEGGMLPLEAEGDFLEWYHLKRSQ